MILFVFYAMLVWYGAYLWRRRWGGLVVLAAALTGLLVVWKVHYRMNGWVEGGNFLPVLRVLLAPYIVLVMGVGVVLVCQRRLPRSGYYCRACQYDLSGLEPAALACPECGDPWTGKGSGVEPPEEHIELIPIPTGPPRRRVSL